MNYKYKRGQIFGKRLNVPRSVLDRVYRNSCTYSDFVDYELFDKIPTSCMRKPDITILNKFGKDICDNLDWEIISNTNGDMYVFDVVMSLNPNTKDINLALYEKIKDRIRLSDYSTKMRELFSDRFIDYTEDMLDRYGPIIDDFNYGKASLSTMVKNWDLFKDRDLSYCLLHDKANEKHVTDAMVKNFMSNHSGLAPIIAKNGDIYSVISDISLFSTPEEEKAYLKQVTDDILRKTKKQYGDYTDPLELTDDEYKELFKYSSMKDYLSQYDSYGAGLLVEELKKLPEDYVFNNSISFHELLNYEVLHFVGTFGLKNIVDFNEECDNFFTKDNYRILRLMFDMYLHYGGNNQDPKTSFYYDKNNNRLSPGNISKNDFYESMRRMFVFGPSDTRYKKIAPGFRDITGEFRVRYPNLFISEEGPEGEKVPKELKDLFYSKQITPKLLVENPDYVKFIKGKDFASCFLSRYVYVYNDKEESITSFDNFYSYIGKLTNEDGLLDFVLQYSDILDLEFDRNNQASSVDELKFYENIDFNGAKSIINTKFREIMIKERLPYPTIIPSDLVKEYPNMFLDKSAPPKLQEAFYNRTLTPQDILLKSYKDYLKGIDLEVLYKYMPVAIKKDDSDKYYNWYYYDTINFVVTLKHIFGEDEALDIMVLYGKYIEKGFEIDQLDKFLYDENISKSDYLNQIDDRIYQYIINGQMKYDGYMSDHFKNKYPTLFLDSNVSDDIKKKFYNREFTLQDFIDNPELLDIFNRTNVAGGFSEELAWIIPLFEKLDDQKLANSNRLKVVEAYNKIENEKLKRSFIKYVKKYGEKINLDRIADISAVFSRLEYSNSIELSSFSEQLAIQLLDSDDPFGKLDKIEKVFLENNSPLCGKMFLCFQILYPVMSEYPSFDFSSDSRVAPGLKDDTLPKVGFHANNDEKRLIVIFNDLLRTSYRSNERSFDAYLDNLENGNEIYYRLQSNGFDLSSLNENEMETLTTFVSHLEVLYNNIKTNNSKHIELDGLSLVDKLKVIGENFHETERYELKDRIVRSFCYTAGIKSFDELRELCIESRREQRERIDRNLKVMEENGGIFKIEEGDFVRGIGYYDTLGSSLNTGNYCKEQLGVFNGTSKSDTTPLDVDLTLVTKTDSLYHAIEGTPTGFGFGNVYVIIKKDNPNISISRDKDGYLTNNPYDPKKVEVFGTSVEGKGYHTHWGARTGFSFADVDYILYKEKRQIDSKNPYDKDGNVKYSENKDPNEYNDLQAIKFEIAKNGYYIPVIDFAGKLIFTKEEFKNIRDKMDGLSYFGNNNFVLSEYLVTPEVEEIAKELTQEATDDTNEKREIINGIIKEVLDEMGISIKYKSDGDLSTKTAEFIDTGSTGRGTNVPYDGDFDFYLRLDADIVKEPENMNKFKNRLIKKLEEYNPESYVLTGNGDIRWKKVNIAEDKQVDIDISFGVKTNKVQYSSDECLRDRLSTIKELYPDQYNNVIANIILAKRVLKDPEVNAYKPRRTDSSQGGMGGIGIENWILQNGGSFVQACHSFLDAAVDENGDIVPFEQFKDNYQLWDFGENHFSARKGTYLHDNFIECNMNRNGYEKMVGAFQGYLKSLDKAYTETDTIKK